ncbi:prepilin-type N-terminal cleavage/methylation domain-containing protein [Candidatus Saccharibacteria bacterium]|nr:prepilin-type N-terminal cleavage/methylation domain-containing protein [Candidatus Saccharibacteria bacterium]
MVTKREQGFTILELMIATMVFSVVLLLVTAGILQVSRVYYKGLTESTTQSTARNIIDTLAQAIQFSGAEVTETHNVNPGKDDSFCIGNKQYSYRLGSQVMNNPSSSDQAWHALVERTVSGSCSGIAAQSLNQQNVVGRDLIGQRMRLAKLVVKDLGDGRYEITVRVVYGDADLLHSPSNPNSPIETAAMKPDATCRPVRAGTQFCATAELSTVVVKRVQ